MKTEELLKDWTVTRRWFVKDGIRLDVSYMDGDCNLYIYGAYMGHFDTVNGALQEVKRVLEDKH